MPPTIPPPIHHHPDLITATPLTPSAFAPFGTAIQNPGSTSPTTAATTVNQGTAHKHLQISPFTNTYSTASSKTPGCANINLFVCRPRALSPTNNNNNNNNVFPCKILERHPYTSQTFIPLGLSPSDPSTYYLVIVAPSDTTKDGNPPDLAGLQAFYCRGSQAVTYAAGTWHAPMVVIGKNAIEFVVLVHENGVEGEDTQEVEIEGEGVSVRVPKDASSWVAATGKL